MIEDRYAKDLAAWQIEHDAGSGDLTLEQEARLRAVMAAHGDAEVADGLTQCYGYVRRGRWDDDIVPTSAEIDAVEQDGCVTPGMLARAYAIPSGRVKGGDE